MKSISINGESVIVGTRTYPNGRIAITLTCEDGMPYATVSTNVPEINLQEREFILSHNCSSILGHLMSAGLFVDTGKKVDYGFVVGQPILKYVG